jgi:hypothetical protein
MNLSKSTFLRGLQCHKSLWLYKKRRDLIPSVPPDKQAIFDQGKQVGELARTYYPGGCLITADHLHPQDALAETEQAMKAGVKVLYEAAVAYGPTLIRADILVRSEDGTGWDIVEVKQSTEEKDEHLPDAAVQFYVLRGAGIPVRKAFLMLINTEYVRQGPIDVQQLFKLVDMTDSVKGYLPNVPKAIKEFLAVLEKPSVPEIEISKKRCHNPFDCEFIPHCWSHVPEYSIFDLTRISEKGLGALQREGIITLDDIPDDFKLTPTQRLQVDVEKSGEPSIEPEAIREHLAVLSRPLYFLDFETMNPAVPPYDGLRPYQQTPFQFSIRIEDGKGKLRHVEYLGDGVNDPRPELAKQLVAAIGPKGSVIAYYARFESKALDDLAAALPEFANALNGIRERIWDLYVPFEKRHYVHPAFRGSASIKDVLPALVPEMTYEGMAIADGQAATRAYLDFMSGQLTAEQAQKIREDLETYCGQDTLAMAKILEILKDV